MRPPCLIFEDEHLLIANKPPGINTHSPSPFAGEGLYEWLRAQEPRWADLAIIHRLDKETSGIIVFAKTRLANQSLTDQFTRRLIGKKYVLLTDRAVRTSPVSVKTCLIRLGDRYLTRPVTPGMEIAETHFSLLDKPPKPNSFSGTWIQAEPLTGRTHQIRVHAADQGFPILGDTRYGGTPGKRLCLHAAQLSLKHPLSQEPLSFEAPADFGIEPGLAIRRALINPQSSTTFRIIHGATDGWAGWYVDVLGGYLLSQSAQALTPAQTAKLTELADLFPIKGVYHKRLSARQRIAPRDEASPQPVLGAPAPHHFVSLENGLHFDLSFEEGYSVGLFLDQRDNRRRLLTGHIAAGFSLFASADPARKPEILNTFAYTCGFSVYGAKAGARLTSLDLSKKYLEWGKRNFTLNQISPTGHDFIYGDVFDWLRRFQKKKRVFDVILLDPPTFSQSKEFGPFRAEKDFGELMAAALPLLKAEGVLLASSNTASWPPEQFVASIKSTVEAARRRIIQEHYFPQPPDFPISRAEPAYLKTLWLRVE